jgi:transposase InsO family protein
MTVNGAYYRSRQFAAPLGQAKHRFTYPYQPQTNGKVERLNRTLTAQWPTPARMRATQPEPRRWTGVVLNQADKWSWMNFT